MREKFVRRLAWLFVICFTFVVLYGRLSPRILHPAALRQIEQLTGSDVSVASIEMQGGGLITIKDLVIGSNNAVSHGKALITARQVEGSFSLWSLIRFKPRLKRITINGFVVNGIYDADHKLWNLSSINISALPAGGKPPVIAVDGGIVKLYRVEDAKIRPIIVVHGKGRLAPAGKAKNNYSFYVEIDNKLGFGGSFFRGMWHSGQRGKVVISEGSLMMNNSPVFGNSWNIEDIRCEAEYDHNNILLESLQWRMAEESLGSISGVITDYRTKGEYELRVRLDKWRLTDEPVSDCLVYGPDSMDLLDKGLQEFLETYKPRGIGGLDLRSKGTFSDLSKSKWTGTVRCDDISVNNKEFPYLLENMVGTIRLPSETNDEDIVIDGLRCRHGDVEVVISGNTKNVDGLWNYDINLVSTNMRLDNDLYAALDDKQKELWAVFGPSGRIGIDYRLKGIARTITDSLLELELKGSKAVYEHFPYPLENLTGKVIIEPEVITLEDVVSRYVDDTRMITLNGKIEQIESENPRFNMVIDANNIPIDSTLSAALPEQQREFYERFNVDAITNSRITVFPNEVGRRKVEYIADVSIKDASMVYKEFPLPLTNVDVEARLTVDKIVLKMMSAQNGKGRVQVSGDIWPATDRIAEMGYCLSVRAEELELNDEWLSTLPKEAGEVARRLKSSGKINVVANLSADAPTADCNDVHIAIECLGNSFKLDKFSHPVENVTGKVEIRQGEGDSESLDVRNATFNMGLYGGRVLGAVEVRELPSGRMSYQLESIFDGVQVADILAATPDKEYATSQGRASGSFTVRGIVGNENSNLGRLRVGISDMKLAKRSLIAKVVAAMQFNEPSDYIFSDMTAEGYVKGNRIFFEKILMFGESVVLLGSGTLNVETNEVDLKFSAHGSEVTSYPSFLETLARGLGPAMVQVEVHGSIDDPQIETRSLPMLQNPLRILGEES